MCVCVRVCERERESADGRTFPKEAAAEAARNGRTAAAGYILWTHACMHVRSRDRVWTRSYPSPYEYFWKRAAVLFCARNDEKIYLQVHERLSGSLSKTC